MTKAERSEVLRRKVIFNKYGITYEEATALLELQNYTCPICLGRLGDEVGRYAQIEHDHKTGVIRGIVCLRCNLALGWIQEDITRLVRMVEYLT